MRSLFHVGARGLRAAGPRSPASADVRSPSTNGRVSLSARDATVRQILTEWARVGQTQIVNVERIAGGPITIEFTNVPEAEALDMLLRSVSGYMAAPRAAVDRRRIAFRPHHRDADRGRLRGPRRRRPPRRRPRRSVSRRRSHADRARTTTTTGGDRAASRRADLQYPNVDRYPDTDSRSRGGNPRRSGNTGVAGSPVAGVMPPQAADRRWSRPAGQQVAPAASPLGAVSTPGMVARQLAARPAGSAGPAAAALAGHLMPLVDEVGTAIADAMRKQDAVRLSALRMLKAALMNREIEKGRALDDAEARQVVGSLVKQRQGFDRAVHERRTPGSRRQGSG